MICKLLIALIGTVFYMSVVYLIYKLGYLKSPHSLAYAAKWGDINLVKKYINKGFDVNVLSAALTPIQHASIKGHLNIVKILIDSGADIDYQNILGETALSWAVMKNHNEIVKLLIENGADVNIQNDQGCSALMAAVLGNNKEIVQLLLRNGADIYSPNFHGHSVIDFAQNKPDILNVINKQLANPSQISSDKQQIESNHKDSNKDYLQIGIEAIRYFFQLNSKNLSESDIKLLINDLETNLDSIPGIDNILNCPLFDSLFFNDNDNLKKIAGIIFIGIFRASTNKHYFLPVGLVKTYFGKSVEEYYPKNSSDEFLEFAKTFMTFKLLLFKLQDNHPNKSITKLFEWLEFNVRSVFFPTPCPIIISIEIRKQAQKDILNMVNYSASIESFINGNPILNDEFEQQQLLGKNYLDQNDMSDEQKICTATQNLCSKIFDIIYSSELHVELNAQDTVLFLVYSYCLCLFAKVGFTNDLRLLEQFHKSVQIYLLNWLNMILSRGKEIEYYESGLYKITKSMIDNFSDSDIFQLYLDDVKEIIAFAGEKFGIKIIDVSKIQHEQKLMAAATTVTRDIKIILNEHYRVDEKAFTNIGVSIHDACINAAFEIAGLEKLPND